MKLLELLGVKKYSNYTADEIIRLMASAKDVTHTGGSAAKVFIKGNVVYKFWGRDTAYSKFLTYVSKHQNNPALPRLLSPIKKITVFFTKPSIKFPNKLFYVKLEKLTSLTNDNEKVVDRNGDKISIIKILRWIKEDTKLNDVLEYYKLEDPSVVENVKNLYKVIIDLRKLFDKKKLINIQGYKDLDIHTGNIMLRGSTFVITDPVIYEEDIIFNDSLDFDWSDAANFEDATDD